MSTINWQRFGEDFTQKYEGTFCRYISPITDKKEVFKIYKIIPYENKGPGITLFNQRVGELYLNYSTEAELDFTFPEKTYFFHENKALLFKRLFQRQWKKGLCSSTAMVTCPYDLIQTLFYPKIDEELIISLFEPQLEYLSIDEAIDKLKVSCLSYPLSTTLALGLSKIPDIYWLWFDENIIAEIDKNKIIVHSKHYIQEIKDYLRKTQNDGIFTL